MAESGRPTKYISDYDELILSEDYDGLFIEQIAKKMEVSKSTLYEWCKHHPSFAVALTRARENCIDRLLQTGSDNLVTYDKNTKLHEKTLSEYLRFAGLGRRLPALAKEDDEHKALAIVQEAVANGEIIAEHAESLSKVLMSKLEARKTIEMADEIKLIKEKLGIE